MEISNVIIILIGVLGTLNNGLLLFIFLLNPSKTFQSNSTYFIKSLTAADFLSSILTILWGVEIFPSKMFRRIYHSIFWMSVQVSFYTVFMMSVERYIAVLYPFKKRLMVTKKRVLVCIASTWLFSATSSGLIVIRSIQYKVQFGLYSLFDLAIIGVAALYIKIIIALKKISKETRRKNQPGMTNGRNSLKTKKIKEDHRLLTVVSIIVAILFFTVLPYTLASQIYMGTRSFCPSCPNNENVVKFSRFYFPIEVLNFVINPIVYAIRLPNYQKLFLALFSGCFQKICSWIAI